MGMVGNVVVWHFSKSLEQAVAIKKGHVMRRELETKNSPDRTLQLWIANAELDPLTHNNAKVFINASRLKMLFASSPFACSFVLLFFCVCDFQVISETKE